MLDDLFEECWGPSWNDASLQGFADSMWHFIFESLILPLMFIVRNASAFILAVQADDTWDANWSLLAVVVWCWIFYRRADNQGRWPRPPKQGWS